MLQITNKTMLSTAIVLPVMNQFTIGKSSSPQKQYWRMTIPNSRVSLPDMICVGIYAVLVNDMIIADNLHSAIFSLAAYTVILCFSLFKSGALAKSIFNAH